MLLYIHVPFCRSRCNYCAFHSLPLAGREAAGQAALLQAYVDTLLLELMHYGDKYKGKTIQSVFFGGGTPSLLPPEMIGNVLQLVGRYFKLPGKVEITLEANPESLRDRSLASAYLQAGINRLSIGVQSLDDATLRVLGRPHKVRDAINAVYNAREAGFGNINIDLMWGLPGQSMRQWLQTLKDALQLGPDHISSYGLTLEPGTPLEKECETGRLALPPERDQSIMFLEGAAMLEANSFLQYEISNFASMGYQCRHNLGYWEGADYLGLGPSATSTISGRRWTNPAALETWTELVATGRLALNAEILTPKTRVLELVMLRLRTVRGLRLKAYRAITGHDFMRDHQKLIQALHENGMIRIRNGYLSLTKSGMLVSNTILSNLFERTEALLDDSPLLERQERTGLAPTMISAGEARGMDKEAIQAIPVAWAEK